MSSASGLLSAPVIVVPRRAGGLVRALVDDAASPATAPDGTVLGKVRQEPPPPARGGRALFLAVSVLVGNPHTARDPTFAVDAPDGSPLLRLVFSGQEVSVRDDGDAELGVLVNEGRPGGEDIVVGVYGPGGAPLAAGRAPYAQAPALTITDPAGMPVARSEQVDEHSVRTEILGDAPVLRTLLTGFACSLVMPEWIDRPRSSSGAAAEPRLTGVGLGDHLPPKRGVPAWALTSTTSRPRS